MIDLYNTCKTCVPKFSDDYWWTRSQHLKYFGFYMLISAVLSLVGTLFLIQNRSDYYVSEKLLDWNSFLTACVVFIFLLVLQSVSMMLVRLIFYMQIDRISRFGVFIIKLLVFVALFYFGFAMIAKQTIIFCTTYMQGLDVRTTGYLEHEYHVICNWILLYATLWMFYLLWKESERFKRSVERNQYVKVQLADTVLRKQLQKYLDHAFLIIVKKDNVTMVTTEGRMDLLGRKTEDLNKALQLDYEQISKCVYIASVEILAIGDGYIEISAKRREMLDISIQKYKKLGEIVDEFKNEHGLLSLSPVYADKLRKS